MTHPMNLCRVCDEPTEVGDRVYLYEDGLCSHQACHHKLGPELPASMLPIADEPTDAVLINEDGTQRVLFSAEDGLPN